MLFVFLPATVFDLLTFDLTSTEQQYHPVKHSNSPQPQNRGYTWQIAEGRPSLDCQGTRVLAKLVPRLWADRHERK